MNNLAIIALSNIHFLNQNNIPKEFDIWTLNGGCQIVDRIDLLFDMHHWPDCEYDIPDYYDYLKKKKNKYHIVKPFKDDNLKNVVLYPARKVMSIMGRNFLNSIPQMLAYAYLVGYKSIYLYGCSKSEWFNHPEMGMSLFYVIGFLRGAGISVYFVNDYCMDRDDDFYGYYRLTNDRIKE